ncbi:hypothetical protein [Kitasatospora sp. P5_F3]
MDESTIRGVRYLLGLAPVGTGARICARLRIDPDGPVGPSTGERYQRYSAAHAIRMAPRSVRIWMLQEDHPELNELLCREGLLSAGVAEDVRSGLLFGPGRSESAPDSSKPVRHSGFAVPEQLIGKLRRATGSGSLKDAREAARELRRADWPLVASAHRKEPFPGYARWALAEQIDCPPELRTAFGSHRKFEHRLRQAGVLGGPVDLLDRTAPALDSLRVLGLGRIVFPSRLAEVEDVLRPMVERELGGHGEAWAVLAQLLPGFTGTLPELIATAGAVAGPAPEHEPEYEYEQEPAAEPVPVPASAPVPVATPAPERGPSVPEAEPTPWQILGGLVRRIIGPS